MKRFKEFALHHMKASNTLACVALAFAFIAANSPGFLSGCVLFQSTLSNFKECDHIFIISWFNLMSVEETHYSPPLPLIIFFHFFHSIYRGDSHLRYVHISVFTLTSCLESASYRQTGRGPGEGDTSE